MQLALDVLKHVQGIAEGLVQAAVLLTGYHEKRIGNLMVAEVQPI